MLSSIYLAGSSYDSPEIIGLDPNYDWRCQAVSRLGSYGLSVINPIEISFAAMDPANINETESDKDPRVVRALDLIDQSDALLANINLSSYGTAMEIFYAYNKGKMVTVVGPSPFSPWILAHSKACFGNIDSALDYIIDKRTYTNPINWALRFEAQLSERYEQFPPIGQADYKFFGGDIPVLVLSPHATGFFKNGQFMEPDTFTGSIAYVLHRLTRAYSFNSNFCLAADPAAYQNTPFNRSLADIIKTGKIGLVLILAGSSWQEIQRITISSSLINNKPNKYLTHLKNTLSNIENNILIEDIDESIVPINNFLTKELNVNTIVIKLHKRYRMPKLQADLFTNLINSLSNFINDVGQELAKEA